MLPTITPELVAEVAHKTYRLRLDSDADREKFDGLEPKKQKSRTVAYEPLARAVMVALGYPEPVREKPKKDAA